MKGNFNDLVNDDRVVIVDFHALWCAPCRMQSPILKEIASELGERIKILKVDVDQNYEIAARYGIQSVPTLIIFKNGEIKFRYSGVRTKAQLMDDLKAIP